MGGADFFTVFVLVLELAASGKENEKLFSICAFAWMNPLDDFSAEFARIKKRPDSVNGTGK